MISETFGGIIASFKIVFDKYVTFIMMINDDEEESTGGSASKFEREKVSRWLSRDWKKLNCMHNALVELF